MDNIKNPRLFSIKERTLQFDYQIKHVPGAGHHAPDAFSRRRRPNHTSSITCLHAPVSEEEYDISSIACAFAEAHSYSAVNALNDIDGAAKAVTITRIKDAANHDQTYCELLQLCQSGFPRDSSQLTNTLRPFWKIHNDLYIADNLLMYGNRLVIPASLRKEVLECLHAAHQGVAGI